MVALGFDIGGTKCAAVLGEVRDGDCRILGKEKLLTAEYGGWQSVLSELFALADRLLEKHRVAKKELCGIGISCGGPLNPAAGLILSPPNLPGWDKVPIAELVRQHFGVKAILCNDADACAVAEWKFGAGKGCENMIFLTFGTGMGAGLILNGRLYSGTNGSAGEVGHIRLAEKGPVGYGKEGSFEGFCSGGGLARSIEYYKSTHPGQEVRMTTAKELAKAAEQGDSIALDIMKNCAEKLGRGLAVLIDILNPEKIVIGSIYARNRAFFDQYMLPVVQKEVLPHALAVCEILPAALGEQIGDYAALGLAVL